MVLPQLEWVLAVAFFTRKRRPLSWVMPLTPVMVMPVMSACSGWLLLATIAGLAFVMLEMARRAIHLKRLGAEAVLQRGVRLQLARLEIELRREYCGVVHRDRNGADVVVFPAASRATAVSVWLPLLAFSVFQVI